MTQKIIKNSSLLASEFICNGFSPVAESLWGQLKPYYLGGIKDLKENNPSKVDRALVYFGRDLLDAIRRYPHHIGAAEADCLQTIENFFEAVGHDDWYAKDGGLFATFADDTDELASLAPKKEADKHGN